MSRSGRARERATPAYDLAEVQSAIRAGRYLVTARVRRHMRRKGWIHSDLERGILQLTEADFHKSQEHLARPGVWLDIYRPRAGRGRRYIKFIADDLHEAFVVLTFCDDGEAH